MGDNLVINGTNFIDTDDLPVSVKIGTVVCPVTSINPGHTQVTCTIPEGARGKTLARDDHDRGGQGHDVDEVQRQPVVVT